MPVTQNIQARTQAPPVAPAAQHGRYRLAPPRPRPENPTHQPLAIAELINV